MPTTASTTATASTSRDGHPIRHDGDVVFDHVVIAQCGNELVKGQKTGLLSINDVGNLLQDSGGKQVQHTRMSESATKP